jgi:hypothetical protein
MAARKTWTKEQREKQRQNIKKWKPWKKSTGPKTLQGKFKSSQNAKWEVYHDYDEFDRRCKEVRKPGERRKLKYIRPSPFTDF